MSSAITAQETDVQALFRMKLVAGWGIPRGAKVLEIGCGQGDMTVALANAVGSAGHITAVDAASPDYGSPVSLGVSAQHLKQLPLGQQIDFHFECDLLDSSLDFPLNAFDYVVLAHCSWYFPSLAHLRRMLQRVRPWAKILCFSEWDMEPDGPNQLAHLLSVLIQGQLALHKPDTDYNVRTPFSRTQLEQLVEDAGWVSFWKSSVDSSALQDAGWEINNCIRLYEQVVDTLDIALKEREFLCSQLHILQSVAAGNNNRSLPSYSLMAK